MSSLTEETLNSLLLNSVDYREFLGKALTQKDPVSGKVRTNYAAFARRAGFSSRSAPRDVLVGTKRITARTLPQFIRGLGLRGDARLAFQTLVKLEERDLNLERHSGAQLKAQLEKIRNRIRHKANQQKVNASIFRGPEWPKIYAALGSSEQGATLAEIQARTRLSKQRCLTILSELLLQEVCSSVGDHFFPKSIHLMINQLGEDRFFKERFLTAVAEVQSKAKTRFVSEENLFLESTFSVRRDQLPALKNELRQLMLKFIDRAEAYDGNDIARLVVGMFD